MASDQIRAVLIDQRSTIRAFYRSDTYRAIYTVRFGEVIYVLHAFQKKATCGIATPKREIEVIKARLKQAEEVALAASVRPVPAAAASRRS